MTTFGLTDQGLVIKRLEDVKAEIESGLQTVLGVGINLLPTELLGQIVGIFSEREALIWELMEVVYNSQYPATATGTSLDNVVAITAIERLAATKSTAVGVATGTQGTIITSGAVVSVNGNPDARFVMTGPFTIGPGTNAVQDIDFSAVPDSGDFTLNFDGDETASIPFGSSAAFVESALETLTTITSVTVTGNFTTGFTITFDGGDGQQPQNLITVGTNTLLLVATPVVITITNTTTGVLPNVECTLEAETAGAVQAPSGSLTVIETVIAGWDAFANAEDAFVGNEIETDAELRLRRDQTLGASATATLNAIYSKLREIDEVEDAAVYHNPTQVTDGDGRPPHSIQAIVLGAEDEIIANALWDVSPAGIELLGTTTFTITDSQGFAQDIKFSRPIDVNIWIEIDLTTDGNFPIDGDTALRDFVVTYCTTNFKIGDDVIVFGSESIASAIADSDIEGITDYVIRVGTTVSPTLDDNVVNAFDEIGDFDTSRTTITIL